MKIPVFHDDQHGTAIIVGAALAQRLEFGGKKLSDAKIVTSGAGAAALACLDLLADARRAPREHHRHRHRGRRLQGPRRADGRAQGVLRPGDGGAPLAEVIAGADVFLGLSAGGVLKREMLDTMANKPLIMALANPIRRSTLRSPWRRGPTR